MLLSPVASSSCVAAGLILSLLILLPTQAAGIMQQKRPIAKFNEEYESRHRLEIWWRQFANKATSQGGNPYQFKWHTTHHSVEDHFATDITTKYNFTGSFCNHIEESVHVREQTRWKLYDKQLQTSRPTRLWTWEFLNVYLKTPRYHISKNWNNLIENQNTNNAFYDFEFRKQLVRDKQSASDQEAGQVQSSDEAVQEDLYSERVRENEPCWVHETITTQLLSIGDSYKMWSDQQSDGDKLSKQEFHGWLVYQDDFVPQHMRDLYWSVDYSVFELVKNASGQQTPLAVFSDFLISIVESTWPVFGVFFYTPWQQEFEAIQNGDDDSRLIESRKQFAAQKLKELRDEIKRKKWIQDKDNLVEKIQEVVNIVLDLMDHPEKRQLEYIGGESDLSFWKVKKYRVVLPAYVRDWIRNLIEASNDGGFTLDSNKLRFFSNLLPQEGQDDQSSKQKLTTFIFFLLDEIQRLFYFEGQCPTSKSSYAVLSRLPPRHLVCIRSKQEGGMVANAFRQIGYWPDCGRMLAINEERGRREVEQYNLASLSSETILTDERGNKCLWIDQESCNTIDNFKNSTDSLPNRELIIDVGANIGACSIVFAVRSYDVIAVEALGENVNYLKWNVKMNSLEWDNKENWNVYQEGVYTVPKAASSLHLMEQNFDGLGASQSQSDLQQWRSQKWIKSRKKKQIKSNNYESYGQIMQGATNHESKTEVQTSFVLSKRHDEEAVTTLLPLSLASPEDVDQGNQQYSFLKPQSVATLDEIFENSPYFYKEQDENWKYNFSIALLKVDTEGHDQFVLESGFKNVLMSHKPVVVAEVASWLGRKSYESQQLQTQETTNNKIAKRYNSMGESMMKLFFGKRDNQNYTLNYSNFESQYLYDHLDDAAGNIQKWKDVGQNGSNANLYEPFYFVKWNPEKSVKIREFRFTTDGDQIQNELKTLATKFFECGEACRQHSVKSQQSLQTCSCFDIINGETCSLYESCQGGFQTYEWWTRIFEKTGSQSYSRQLNVDQVLGTSITKNINKNNLDQQKQNSNQLITVKYQARHPSENGNSINNVFVVNKDALSRQVENGLSLQGEGEGTGQIQTLAELVRDRFFDEDFQMPLIAGDFGMDAVFWPPMWKKT